MSDTPDTGDLYTTDSTGKPEGSLTYVLGLSFAIIILLLTLSYASYKCNRSRQSQSPPVDDEDRNHLFTVSRGVDDAVLMTFPVFVYSEHVMPHKVDSATDANGSGCSICLADYKPTDVIRLLPKCGHFFHRKCIDTWLKVHPTCPVCRNSPSPEKLSIQIQRS
ncbi:unnamed protein product [Lactuca saligna]|uniref:RING-type E3 ubiquitin transferase n=1 Tax=Lactuca saligna TaxID=75948 RepID=A0AA35YFZ5_LACSI|nr:unnamed protein product [Lactuca saligna]